MQSIFDTMQQYHMIEAGMHVIAGVSGGADSVCLLYVMQEYRKQVPFELTVVHVEHGLRGEESLADVAFTQELCRRFDVPCRIVHAQVEQLAKEERLSVEEAGRKERYRIFEDIKEQCHAQRIAVAHNQNDQAETVLWNLARGSGLSGLSGMSPVRGDIIRPLLFTSRSRIEQILIDAGLSFRTDRTNLQQEYTRNRIRLSILPQMETDLNERATEHVADAADRLRQVREYLLRMTERAAASCIFSESGTICINLQAYEQEDDLIRQELLRRAVGMCGGMKDFGSVHLQALMRLCSLDCGKEINLPGRIRAVRQDGIVRLSRADNDISVKTLKSERHVVQKTEPVIADDLKMVIQEIKITVPGKFRAGKWNVYTEFCENSPELMGKIFTENKYTKWLSYDTIKGNDLVFRTRRTGDYLIVNQQGGKKKLKDYLIDIKIPKEQRDHIWLLANGAHILWVLGYRISETAKITEHTKKIIKVHLEEEHEREDKDFFDGEGSE